MGWGGASGDKQRAEAGQGSQVDREQPGGTSLEAVWGLDCAQGPGPSGRQNYSSPLEAAQDQAAMLLQSQATRTGALLCLASY